MDKPTTKVRKNLDIDATSVKILKDYAVTKLDSNFKQFAEKILEDKAIEIQNNKTQN